MPTISRNARTSPKTLNGKRFYPSSNSPRLIKSAVRSGKLEVQKFVLATGQRLDVVAANFYGDPAYWWVIAAASGIGWQCQVPPGTLLLIPVSLNKVIALVG